MKYRSSLAAMGAVASTLLTGVSASLVSSFKNETDVCISPRAIPDLKGSDIRNVGMIIFPALDMIDVFGPLEPLQFVAKMSQQMQLHLIAETMEPISTGPVRMNTYNSSFWPTIPPTNTFDEDLDLDVLIVPGGSGVRAPNLQHIEEYIARMFPKVKFLINICTGSGLSARAGVLDDYLSTTNKAAFDEITPWGPNVNWVSPARYVIDGKVWSSSGVTSSLDLVFEFVETYWGKELSERIAGLIEHVPREWDDDPFSEIHEVPPTEVQPCSIP